MRKANLLESLCYFQFLQDSEEEEAWLVETTRILKSTDTGKDLRAVISLMRKHEVRQKSLFEGTSVVTSPMLDLRSSKNTKSPTPMLGQHTV